MSEHYKMIEELTGATLLAIHPSAAKVLLVMVALLLQNRVEVGVDEICQAGGQTDHTVKGALVQLQTLGLVDQDRDQRYHGWFLTRGARQLPIMQYIESGQTPASPSGSRKIYDSIPGAGGEVLEIESQNLRLDPLNTPGVVNFTTQKARESQNLRLPPTSLSSLSSSSLTIDSEELLLKLAAARQALEAAGCSPDQVESFIQRYPPERILHATDVYVWARHTRKRNGTGLVANDRGYLINFITRNWSAPQSYIPADRRCAHCWRSLSDHAYDCPALRPVENIPSGSPCPAQPSGGTSAPDTGCDPMLEQAWPQVLEQLSGGDLHQVDIDTWVRPLEPGALTDGVVTLRARTSPVRDWVAGRPRVQEALETLFSRVLGQTVRVSVLYDYAQYSG